MPAEKETFSLYSGEVQLVFSPSSHRYKVSDRGSKPEHCPSNTTVLNVLAKPALIEWGIRIACDYVHDNLEKLVSGDSFSVQDVYRIIEQARTAHDRAREEAADIGTSAHDWLRDYWRAIIRKTDLPDRPTDIKPKRCVENALDFFSMHKMEPVAIEAPLYSREHKICGRCDWIGYIDDEFATQDYKSTKSIYPEVALQMSGYAMMYEEEHKKLPNTCWALRLDKEGGDFEARRYPPEIYPLNKDSFLACFKIYDRLKHLRRKPKPETEEKVDLLAGL